MIHNRTPLSIAETSEYINEPTMKAFMKKFASLDSKKAKELRKKIQDLNILKINDKHTSKIIDLLPTDKEALNKIVQESNLDENETNSILQAVKEAK